MNKQNACARAGLFRRGDFLTSIQKRAHGNFRKSERRRLKRLERVRPAVGQSCNSNSSHSPKYDHMQRREKTETFGVSLSDILSAKSSTTTHPSSSTTRLVKDHEFRIQLLKHEMASRRRSHAVYGHDYHNRTHPKRYLKEKKKRWGSPKYQKYNRQASREYRAKKDSLHHHRHRSGMPRYGNPRRLEPLRKTTTTVEVSTVEKINDTSTFLQRTTNSTTGFHEKYDGDRSEHFVEIGGKNGRIYPPFCSGAQWEGKAG